MRIETYIAPGKPGHKWRRDLVLSAAEREAWPPEVQEVVAVVRVARASWSIVGNHPDLVAGIALALGVRVELGVRGRTAWAWLRVVSSAYEAWIVDPFYDLARPDSVSVHACRANSRGGAGYRGSAAEAVAYKHEPGTVGTAWAATLAAQGRLE